MKKNDKGFTLLETLIVSTFVVGTLIYLFTQINNVKTSYDISFRYNTIPGIFSARNVADYLKENVEEYDLGSSEYKNITNPSLLSSNINSDYYNALITYINAKQVLLVKDDLTNLKNNIRNCYDMEDTNNTSICGEASEEMKNFILKLDTNESIGIYRVIIEFNDNTFSSLEIG